MALLSSSIFTAEAIDTRTRQRLEDCAAGGNETLTHIAHGQRGEHVRRVQEALSRVKDAEPSLGIPAFSINGVYDPAFARAVFVYKQARDIRNFRDQIDDIVGVKTIKSLDKDNQPSKPKVQPGPAPERPVKPKVFPRPDGPNCVADENCPTSQAFSVQVVGIITAGDILEAAVMRLRFRDTQNLLTADYNLKALGLATPGLPVSANTFGEPQPFGISPAVRITRFGPLASVEGGNPFPIHGSPSFFFLTLSSRRDGSAFPSLGPTIKIDTGKNPLASAGVHAGKLELVTTCRAAPGAFLGSRPLVL